MTYAETCLEMGIKGHLEKENNEGGKIIKGMRTIEMGITKIHRSLRN